MHLPKVSCILPWGYGYEFIATALLCFFKQDYAGELELVLVDNNDEPLMAHEIVMIRQDKRVKYVRTKRMSVGALRNLGTQHATGEICVSWDEDDWSAPSRVTEQVNRLMKMGKAVTGWHNILYYVPKTGNAYKYLYSPDGTRHSSYAMGTSQCYHRDWWESHPFVEQGIEDEVFSREAAHAGMLDSCDAGQLCVALIHDGSVGSNRNNLGHRQWPQVERTALPKEFLIAIGEGCSEK